MSIKKFLTAFKIKDLREKIFFILAIFVLFRIMANIPVLGVQKENLKEIFDRFQTLGLLNVFTGGTLEKVSIVMLGLGPYITASIIMQLLTMVFPQLKKMYQEGTPQEREKFEQYSRLLTVPVAALQSAATLSFFASQKVITFSSPLVFFQAVLTIVASTLLLMWLGELITEKGLGNGVSLLIFAGIVADFPNNILALISEYFLFLKAGFPLWRIIINYSSFILIALIIIMGVVMVNESKREIPVSYAKRVRGRLMYGGSSTYLPININPAGVMPIIFALSILSLPSMIANFLISRGGKWAEISNTLFSFLQDPFFYGSLYFVLVFLFTFFYTMVVFDPKSISENLQKMGGFIPGIRPGENTANYLSYILYRILPLGGLFLAFIAIFPSIVQFLTFIQAFSFLVGGTSILIMVSVILETARAIEAQVEMREYEKF
jgi:preprotein translocase subunit SecY